MTRLFCVRCWQGEKPHDQITTADLVVFGLSLCSRHAREEIQNRHDEYERLKWASRRMRPN